MREAKCFECLTPGMWQAIELALLCDLIERINNLANVTKPQVFSGHYNGFQPTTPTPDATVTAALNYDLDAPFQMWRWDSVAQSWTA